MVTPIVPPFTRESATQKVRGAEDAWNSRDPERIALAYTEDSHWRNRTDFVDGRAAIIAFLKQKWARELEYRLVKEMWAFDDDKIAVRYCYESRGTDLQWYRSYGNENWQFDEAGLMRRRHSSINDMEITDAERRFHWDTSGPRPVGEPGLTELGL